MMKYRIWCTSDGQTIKHAVEIDAPWIKNALQEFANEYYVWPSIEFGTEQELKITVGLTDGDVTAYYEIKKVVRTEYYLKKLY